jgi:hypothetical protein
MLYRRNLTKGGSGHLPVQTIEMAFLQPFLDSSFGDFVKSKSLEYRLKCVIN